MSKGRDKEGTEDLAPPHCIVLKETGRAAYALVLLCRKELAKWANLRPLLIVSKEPTRRGNLKICGVVYSEYIK